MTHQKPRITLVGAGRIGCVLLKRLLDCGYPCAVLEHRQDNLDRLLPHPLMHGTLDLAEAIEGSQCILLCIKPKAINPFLDQLSEVLHAKTCVISMAAGISLDQMRPHLSEKASLLRVMPTVSAEIGKGILACCAEEALSNDDKALCEQLLQHLGSVAWLSESEWPLFTAVVGSGPAFMAAMVDGMAKRLAQTYDVDASLMTTWLQLMCQGTLEYMQAAHLSAEALIDKVKAPKGTTEAGFLVQGDVFDWEAAIHAAYAKAHELASH